MKNQEMGDAIARACHWTRDHDAENDYLYRTKDGRGMYNPAADLNAMHEAEKVLAAGDRYPLDRWYDYGERLKHAVVCEPENISFGEKPTKKFTPNGFGYAHLAHATAAQRCEAFLKCLNLWTT